MTRVDAGSGADGNGSVPNRVPLQNATALSRGVLSAEPLLSEAAQDFHWLGVNIPCRTACPAGTDIPGYLEAVYQGRFADAYAINLRDNVFPGVLGRVCSRPCEDACRHGREGLGDPVAICFSKRSAADHLERPPASLPMLAGPTGHRVAVIGAGVAGLTVARELARQGHGVSVLERHERPGGMLNQGIPAFRLPRDLIDREVQQVLALGIDIRCGVEVGRDVTLEALLAEHDAVILAAGTQRPNAIPLPGVELDGIEHGLRFLLGVNEQRRTAVGQRTVVLGGGYTAMDCARTALRLGSRTGVFYRRGREDMVVLPGELEEFLAEGGSLEASVAPVAFLGVDGRVTGVRFVRTRPGPVGADGRRGFEAVPDSTFDVPADQVILATGQFPDTGWIDPALAPKLVGRDGWLQSGARHETGIGRLFVAGDYALGATTLIQAIGHAKTCAAAVDRFLMGRERRRSAVAIGPVAFTKRGAPGTGRTQAHNVIPIHPMPVLPPAERIGEAEVETGYDDATAREAASRCYLCHYKFEIIDSRCVLCDECINVKPVADCIVEIAGLIRDDDGRVTGYEPVRAGRTSSLYYNRLWIDQDRCIRCGQCEAACPVGAITIQKITPAIVSA